ncbi:hypothetical protein P7K49_002517 [Saguinus oedipus]|uniref:DH domain-containing protein n=1 Tax=Saguinus oedipus TaxID=9490 RepID=A0ABQ9WIJ7_SAGOE|nr:hypothetical protein P7K49_002517 [Saguinus oedipus]
MPRAPSPPWVRFSFSFLDRVRELLLGCMQKAWREAWPSLLRTKLCVSWSGKTKGGSRYCPGILFDRNSHEAFESCCHHLSASADESADRDHLLFEVPELYEIHKEFYDGLFSHVQQWSHQQRVGDLFQKLVLGPKELTEGSLLGPGSLPAQLQCHLQAQELMIHVQWFRKPGPDAASATSCGAARADFPTRVCSMTLGHAHQARDGLVSV